MQALNFILSLTNRLSGPLGSAQRSVQQFAQASQESFAKIAIGGAALWGVGKTVQGMLNPAHDLQVQLDELSINVDSSSLDAMYKKAQDFSTAYGHSAVDFIKSSIAIKRSVDGLTDKELPRYTAAVNTLGVALGKSGEETANYLLDMQNRYSTVADSMGRVQFAEMMASKTAYLAKNFGTDMAKIQATIKTTKNAGESFGIDMNEQLAVLGLVGKKIGEEAGGSYNAFLKSVTAGSQKLGLKLTDQNGHLMKMPEIMQKLEAKYGKSIAGNAKAQEELNAAFGEGAGVINALWGNTEKLNVHMDALAKTQGLSIAGEMAAKMTDQWQRLEKTFERIRIAIGMQMMPTLSPFVDQIIGISIRFAEWLDMFPNITRWIGYVILGVLAFAAAAALLNIVMGISRFLFMGILPLFKSLKFIALLSAGKFNVLSKTIGILGKSFTYITRALSFFRTAAMSASIAMAGLTWPVVLVIAVIAVLILIIIKCWDWIKAFTKGFIQGFSSAIDSMGPMPSVFGKIGIALGWVWDKVKGLFSWFMDLLQPIEYTAEELAGATSAGQTFGTYVAMAIGFVADAIAMLFKPIELIFDLFCWLFDVIPAGWNAVINFFSENSPVKTFVDFNKKIYETFMSLFKGLMTKFAEFYNFIAEKLNYLPGVDIEMKPIGDLNLPSDSSLNIGAMAGATLHANAGELPSINSSEIDLAKPAGLIQRSFAPGGISQAISEATTKTETTDNSKKIQTLNYYASEKQTADEFMERMELNAG